ncbi:MAG: winged helix-turn-helix domain-containing protein [Actinomycetota bacterium]|nr:winged helix-turn-helix domain-containing protein [Actinomycetota bacterium]
MVRMLLVVILSAVKGRVAPRRDFKALEERRRQAARWFGQGVSQAEVARRLEVSRQSVSRWYADWSQGGAAALRGAGRAGRLPKLTKAQLRAVDRVLRKGPLAHGYDTELWTLARVAEVIEAITGVRYHPGHVWRVLRQLGWSRQRPARRAVERDDDAIAGWRANDWPRVKKTPAAEGPGSFSRTSRGSP